MNPSLSLPQSLTLLLLCGWAATGMVWAVVWWMGLDGEGEE